MTYSVQVSNKAQKDLDSILDYLYLFGKLPAQNFIDAFSKQLNVLEDGAINYALSRFPELSKLGYHAVFFNNYVLLYYEEENIRIVSHVFHQSQNYAKLV